MSSRTTTSSSAAAEHVILEDTKNKKKYKKGKFLGKGGFAKCFEVTCMSTGKIMAAKIVSKSLLTKPHQREKMSQEIRIHRSLTHKHIVNFISYFEDPDNVYMILELCGKKSLMELHKRRKAVTEPEARYILLQLLDAAIHLHKNKVIHRDLKLGNLFINDNMELKLGDFGLATRLDFDGERKRTLCGTPNYIAPEVLNKLGHSYEVDMWSIGCIMFTLLVGKPPFETTSLKDTYNKIKRNDYFVPPRVSTNAQMLIVKLLRPDPSQRPTAEQCLREDFFTTGYTPKSLPVSCLMMPPHFDTNITRMEARKPLREMGPNTPGQKTATNAASAKLTENNHVQSLDNANMNLVDLRQQITDVLKRGVRNDWTADLEDDLDHPMSAPLVWISKWVDYSDKYGLGYQLCNDTAGVLYNDSTRLLLAADNENLQYIERDGKEYFYKKSNPPSIDGVRKKIQLLRHFMDYMKDHLLTTGETKQPLDIDNLARWPCLHSWFRTSAGIILFLNNGTLQINFFTDHTKVILCPKLSAVSYINQKRQMKTFTLDQLGEKGCSQELHTRLQYAHSMIGRMLSSETAVGKLA